MKPDSLFNKRLLITGAEGFTGRHLEVYFAENGVKVYGSVYAPDEKPNHIKCDLNDQEEVRSLVREVKPDYVIHTAALSFVGEKNKTSIYRTNVLGTENLLNALIESEHKPEKVILASSATVYGEQGAEVLVETMCPRPVNHYGCSKLAMEHIAANYYSKLDILIVRPFNYTGQGQAEHFLIPKIVKAYQSGAESIELGNLDVSREFNDVRDVCTVYHRLLQNKHSSEVVNLCSGKAIALMDIIEMMNQISRREMEVRVNPDFVRKNEIKTLRGDTDKLQKIVEDTMSFDIYETLEWMYHDK